MQLIDVECPECGAEVEDVWEDEVPVCHVPMVKVWKHAPIVDAKMPFYVQALGKTFTTTRQMDRYADSVGKVVEQHNRKDPSPTYKIKTTEERLADGQKKANLKEIIKKNAYRIKHGYVDQPRLTSEAQLAKETP